MNSSAAAFLQRLPPELAAHAAVLQGLVDAVEADSRWRWLELCCSVARGAGDADSDLDLALGIAEVAWPAALDDLPAMLAGLGEVIDALYHQLTEWGGIDHRRVFVQYANGVQVDLVAVPASFRTGLPPGAVALHDPDGRLAHPYIPQSLQPSPAEVREWAFLGWVALADLAKYLRRESPWEALERLATARNHAWQLWAAGHGIAYPAFGLTSVLDAPDTSLPDGIPATVASLDPSELQRAGLACADLLERASAIATARVGGDPPTALAAFVRNRLQATPA